MIKEFKRGEDVQLTPHFHLSEFECRCGECPTTLVDLDHMEKLEQLRDKLNKPITINSAYRCLEYNRTPAVGSNDRSQHPRGTATDIAMKGGNFDAIVEYSEGVFDGIGRYNTFTHLDSRGRKARWDKRHDT